jgi:hypothetical protein
MNLEGNPQQALPYATATPQYRPHNYVLAPEYHVLVG